MFPKTSIFICYLSISEVLNLSCDTTLISLKNLFNNLHAGPNPRKIHFEIFFFIFLRK